MIKLLSTLIAPALLLSACSNGGGKPQDLTSLPTLEIAATHAIEVSNPTRDLTFVPNDIAPWLGRLVMLSSSGEIFSTDIEGRTPNKTGDKSYSSIFGFSRPKASGVFFTKTDENKLVAFVESNDEGHFSAMRTSGADVSIEAFCKAMTPSADTAVVLTTDFKVLKIKTNIEDTKNGIIPGLEYTIADEISAPKVSRQCAVAGKTTYTITGNPDFQTLHTYTGSSWSKLAFPSSIQVSPIVLNENPYLLVVSEGNIYLFDSKREVISQRIIVKSGLSIRGLNSANMVSSTQSNFGGGAFSEGVVAFGQADEDRIVFVSLSYLASVVENEKS